MAVIKVDENDPVGEVEPSFPFRDVKIMHNVDVRDFYNLKEEIGRGKFGTVYRCVEKKSGIELAAKFVAIAKKQDRINVEREVEIMRTLQHPRLIQLYDSFEIHNVMCVVLELIEGGELFERVIDDDFILTEKACSVFMRQICEGVSFIHINKIIHLDLKPENILCLTKTGNRIKIIDFGLARKYDPNKKLQVLFGTPEFVAPEVVNFDEITSATDMWSVGVICYVLLSGLSPFMGENDLQTMTNVTMAQYDFDDEAFDSISADAKDFISKLLVKNKEKRLSAGSCLSHPWLKRKPPPPPMYLETSKENLKTYVDNNHSSSPYLIADSLSNGSINNQLTDIVPEKTILKVDEKSRNLINFTPKISAAMVDVEKERPNKDRVELRNEINLGKTNNSNTIITQGSSLGINVKSPQLPEINVTPNVKYEDSENVNRRVIFKTDSFKELPRKFSVTISDGSRELPRRSSLTRADKAKNEIKRETFVSFIGPKEIKPIDTLSPDVQTAVEELTKFIKNNIEESINSPEIHSKKEKVPPINENNMVQSIKKDSIASVDENRRVNNDDTSAFKEVSRSDTHLSDANKSSNIVKINMIGQLPPSPKPSHNLHQEQKRSCEMSPLLRPIDYLKLINKSKDSVHINSSFSEISTHESIKGIDKTRSLETEKKSIGNQSYQNILTSYTKEVSYLKPTYLSSKSDTKEVIPRNQHHQDIHKKILDKVGRNTKMSHSTDNSESNTAKLKSSESISVKSWHSTAMRNDLTLPRRVTQSSKNYDSIDNSKETSDVRNSRAISLDPSSPSTISTQDQPFQSRFLKNTSFKSDSSRCSSETPISKYEDFRSRYSNYKELVMDNEKLLKKGIVERGSSRKKENSEDPSVTTNRKNSSDSPSQTTNCSVNQSSSTSQSTFSSRQKYKITEQQRDVPYTYAKTKCESTSSGFRDKDRCYTNISSFKESSSQKHSHVSSQNSESKSKTILTEKHLPNIQK